jgi:carbonic anhydrase
VLVLKVANIVVWHSECGAMKAVYTRNPKLKALNLDKWLYAAGPEFDALVDGHRRAVDRMSA